MDKLAEVNVNDLQAALATAPTAKATKRLMIALAYADGVRVETLSERYDISRATVYSWLGRFEHQSIPEAIADESRPDAHRSSMLRSVGGYPMNWRDHQLSWDTMHRNGHLNVSRATLNRCMASLTRWGTSGGCFANSELLYDSYNIHKYGG